MLAIICCSISYVCAKTPKDEEAEVRLALSACPASIAKSAAVYVLRKQGHVKVRESQNLPERIQNGQAAQSRVPDHDAAR